MKVSWAQVEQQAIDTLRDLIRLDTTNPPGNERIATDYLAAVLGRSGFDPVVIESRATRANLVTRIAGSDGAAPLMLSFHTDVVPVEKKRWTRDPFAGEVAEGCVWGRGAVDMKNKGAMDVALMSALKRAGAAPDRELILAAVADEEAGSELGAEFLVERHPNLIRAGYVLNEAGGFTLFFGDRRFYPIQIAEKGFVTVEMTVLGKPGHGSMPREDSALVRLCELIVKIARTPMRRQLSPMIRGLLEQLGIAPDAAPPPLQALMANTVSPNIIKAGYKDNVIPGEASVVLDGRTLPGENPESFMAELRELVGPEPTFKLLKTQPPAEASADTPLFRLIADRTEAADPGSRAIPWMIPGATDNKFYSRLGATCYGFAPVRLKPNLPFGSLFHGNDERIPIDGFLWGLRVYADVVMEFAGLRFEDVFE